MTKMKERFFGFYCYFSLVILLLWFFVCACFSCLLFSCLYGVIAFVVILVWLLPVSPNTSYHFTSVRLLVKRFFQNWLISFFWFFVWSEGTIIPKKWRGVIFVENSFLPKFVPKGPKNRLFWICHLFFLKTMQNESCFDAPLSIANHMSGNVLVLELLLKMFLTNQTVKCVPSRHLPAQSWQQKH